MATYLTKGFTLTASQTVYFATGNVYQDNINARADARITGGCDSLGTRFCPAKMMTRAQMASFLARAMDLSERVSIPLSIEPGDKRPVVEVLQSRLRCSIHGATTKATRANSTISCVERAHVTGVTCARSRTLKHNRSDGNEAVFALRACDIEPAHGVIFL